MLITLKPWWTKPLPWEHRQTPRWQRKPHIAFWNNRNSRFERDRIQQQKIRQTMWLRVRQKMIKKAG